MRKPNPPRRDRPRQDRAGAEHHRSNEKKFGKERSLAPRGAARDERPHRADPERAEKREHVQHRSEGAKPPFRAKPSYGEQRAPRASTERRDKREHVQHRSEGGKPAFRPKPSYGEQHAPDRPKPLFRSRKGWRPPVRDRDGPVFLYGWHSVKAALENPTRKFLKIMATENALHRLREDGIALPVEPELVRAEAIDALVGPDAVHQGLLVEADPLPSPDIDDVPATGIILVLDQVTDPHNVGAILRTAAAFGVTAIVTTQRHAPEATGVLAKAASGALDMVPIVAVTNLVRALEALKKNNVFVVGLDSEGDGELTSVPIRGPLALVIGAEGKGLRQLTRATCDQVARLDLPGKIKSLNVSNATALALFIAASRIAPGSDGGAGP